MKIGAQIGLWKRDLKVALKDISTAELEGIEVFDLDMEKYYNHPGEFRSLLNEFNLTLSGMYYGGDFITLEAQHRELKRASVAIRFLRAVNGEFLVLNSGSGRKEGGYPVSAYENLADTMNKIGKISLDHDIKVACHPHRGTMVENRTQLDILMNRLDPDLVGLCPHAAHLLWTGADPYDIYRTYADRVNYVHVSDAVGVDNMVEAYDLLKILNKMKRRKETLKGGEEMLKKMSIRTANLGQGEIDQRALMEPLLKAGFDGWVIIEGVDPESTPLEGIRVAANYLKKEFMT